MPIYTIEKSQSATKTAHLIEGVKEPKFQNAMLTNDWTFIPSTLI